MTGWRRISPVATEIEVCNQDRGEIEKWLFKQCGHFLPPEIP